MSGIGKFNLLFLWLIGVVRHCWGIRRVNAGLGNPFCVVVTCKEGLGFRVL